MGAPSLDRNPSAQRRVEVVEVVARLGLMVLMPVVLPRVFWGDPTHYMAVAARVHPFAHPDLQYLPFRRVFWEYPPLTVPVLALWDLAFGHLAVYRALVGAVMVGCEVTCLHVLRRAWPERWTRITVIWTVTVLPIALLTWFRLDFLVTLLATVALVSIVRQRAGGTGWIVGGFATKLWPIVLVGPLVALRRWREATTAVAGTVVVMAAWYLWSPAGVDRFLHYRSGRGLEIESLFGGFDLLRHPTHPRVVSGAWVLFHAGGDWAQPLLYALLIAVAGACLYRARRPGADIVALAGSLTVASMLLSWILSPQYIVWAAPFVVLVASGGRRRLAVLYGAATALTFVYLLGFHDWYTARGLGPPSLPAAGLIVVRNLLLVAVLVELFAAIRPAAPRTA